MNAIRVFRCSIQQVIKILLKFINAIRDELSASNTFDTDWILRLKFTNYNKDKINERKFTAKYL